MFMSYNPFVHFYITDEYSMMLALRALTYRACINTGDALIACINRNNRMRACVDGKNAFRAVELDPLQQILDGVASSD